MNLSKKRQMMLALVEQWQQSGKTQKDFAAENEIALSKLHYWIKKKRQQQPEGFLELTSPCTSPVIIRYPNGVELQLSTLLTVNQLRDIIFL